jgi:hypothetical protein
MKALIFLNYHRYYQELKGNAIKSKYPPRKKKEVRKYLLFSLSAETLFLITLTA